MKIAEVYVNIPVKSISKSYTYKVPDELSMIDRGWRVVVPFGGRRVEGFVLGTKNIADGDVAQLGYAIKNICSAVDEEAWFTPPMIEASQWFSDFYLCSLAEAMRLFMPGKSGIKIRVCYVANEGKASEVSASELYGLIYDTVKKNGEMTAGEIKNALPNLFERPADYDNAIDGMIRRHYLNKEYVTEKRERAQYEEAYALKAALTSEVLSAYSRRPAQRKMLEMLSSGGALSKAALKAQGVSMATIKNVLADGLVAVTKKRIYRDSYKSMHSGLQSTAPLTDEQKQALEKINTAIDKGATTSFLLHGVTGSGKTRVYIEAVSKVIENGKQAIVLVPEIGLTGQLVRSFKTFFPDDIITIHSKLTLSERNDAYARIRRREKNIIIGARSALFTPVTDLGIIVMDEEQDLSYKQDEAPRYDAHVVAEELARIHRAVLILGSATPSLETYHRAQSGQMMLLKMPHRIGIKPMPDVEHVDMREELKHGNRHVLSTKLQTLIRDTIKKHEQVILMLNRRGFSTFVMCRSCGFVMKCGSCGLPLVYHKQGYLACHHCDEKAAVPSVCPQCGSTFIKYFGTGTEKLENELKEIIPEARVIRLDRDTTSRKFAHTEILDAFRRGEYDVLLGTQMVAKGHDIPNVTAVGILSADSSLNMPDFRAAERCFMLITQTAGRAGRGDKKGHVVVQCYNPEHYAVVAAIHQDYDEFYRQEIVMRRCLFFPPFCRIVKLTFLSEKEDEARGNAIAIKERFMSALPHDADNGETKHQIIGPAPATIAQFRGTYRYNLIIKTSDLVIIQRVMKAAKLHERTDVLIDIDPIMF